jgi:hypothetical protein
MLEFSAMPANILYLTVLPLIRPTAVRNALAARVNVIARPGSVEQVLTLFPDRDFATEFYEDEVQFYIDALDANIPALSGGHVVRYEIFMERTNDGRVIVRVVQHVA